MTPRLEFPDAVPEFRGALVDLRELTEDDVPAWFERASDPASAALSGDPIPESLDAGQRWLRRHRKHFREQTGIRWAIVPKGSATSVGSIGLSIIRTEDRIAELGIVIGRAHWGKGIGTSAARLVVGYAFERLGLSVIQAELLRSNEASRRVLEKLGFNFVRDLSDDPQAGADRQDCCVYALSRPNWAAAAKDTRR